MDESLNVVALISGGKDSLFCLAHCVQNGHKVVALANLYPDLDTLPQAQGQKSESDIGEGSDLNSFMYQTVGHSIIPLYAKALELDLFRRKITGSAQQTGRYYDSSAAELNLDETEDLVALLRNVLKHHPQINAVCSGAILSTYQRTRIESVAIRLGLIPLSYLWQYPALPPPSGRADSLSGLLEDMSSSGCEAIIIKIATGGIKEKLMCANVADESTIRQLVSGMTPFFDSNEFWLRGAILGEGGEYETLALEGPRTIWKRRIQFDKVPAVYSAEGGTLYARLGNARLVEREPDNDDSTSQQQVPTPELFDAQFLVLRQMPLTIKLMPSQGVLNIGIINSCMSLLSLEALSHTMVSTPTQTVFMSNIFVPSSSGSHTTSEQMAGIAHLLKSRIQTISADSEISPPLTTDHIVFSTLLLSSMGDFATVNPIYASMFTPGKPNPPARVTVACPLPEGVTVALSVVLDLSPRDNRRGLHVQGRSYWAPANIGPYSQAVCVPLVSTEDKTRGTIVPDAHSLEVVHVAGQIPLVPQNMQILPTSFADQAILSLQHLWRIGQERGVDAWVWGVAFLAEAEGANMTLSDKALFAAHTWKETHISPTRASHIKDTESELSEEQGDAWDRQYNRLSGFRSALMQSTVGAHLHVLPSRTLFNGTANAGINPLEPVIPPFIAAEVSALPRNAPVEWWSLGLSGLNNTEISSNQTQLSISRETYPWGGVGFCRVRASQMDETLFHERDEFVTAFVSILINRDCISTAPPWQQLVAAIVSFDSAMSNDDMTDQNTAWRINHGTAYTPSFRESNPYLPETRADGAAMPLCIVPCHRVWGILHPAAQEHTTVNGAEEASQILRELSLAIVLRLDRC